MTKYFWCLLHGSTNYMLLESMDDFDISYNGSDNLPLHFREVNASGGVSWGKYQFEDIIPIQKPSNKAVANQLAKKAEEHEKAASELRKRIKKLRKNFI